MRPAPSVDSKKFDIAVAKAITGHEIAAMLSLCAKFKLRNSGPLI
jgi:hypothetical protein